MCYEDDFYSDPSEFDLQVEEFKASLMKSVKEEFLHRMEALEKENAALRHFRDEKKAFIRDCEAKVAAAQREARKAEEKWKNARLHQLLGDFLTEGWRVGITYQKGPKCDHCDENRLLHFKSPKGRDLQEECDCAQTFHVHHPKKVILSHFTVKKNDFSSGVDWNLWGRYYSVKEDDGYDRYESMSDVYERGCNIKKVRNQYSAVFLSEEDCQRYCDWLNDQEAKKRAKEAKG